jgi:hypothetical protein
MASTTAQRQSLLHHRNFIRLWTAATVSLFGTQISLIAIPFIAAVLLGASAAEVGLLTTIEFLPFCCSRSRPASGSTDSRSGGSS